MMAVVPTYGRESKAFLEALGVTGKLRTLDLRLRVGEFVTIHTTQFADGDSLDRAARLIEEREYQLFRWVPIEQELPPVGADVWFVAQGSLYRGRRLECEGVSKFQPWGFFISPVEATHWAYPPAAPKPVERATKKGHEVSPCQPLPGFMRKGVDEVTRKMVREIIDNARQDFSVDSAAFKERDAAPAAKAEPGQVFTDEFLDACEHELCWSYEEKWGRWVANSKTGSAFVVSLIDGVYKAGRVRDDDWFEECVSLQDAKARCWEVEHGERKWGDA
jgi:hypothetical protein